MPSIQDREVEILATYSGCLQPDYDKDDPAWQSSPFDWIRKRPSRQKGTIGERLISGYLACKGFDVNRSPDSEADRVVGGKRAEIKMSFLWESGVYKFQQFRDQNYDLVICLGLSPFDAHCWVLPKKAIIYRWRRTGDIRPQHGGGDGRDTAWLNVKPDNVPAWLKEYGGRLSEAVELISKITGQRPLK